MSKNSAFITLKTQNTFIPITTKSPQNKNKNKNKKSPSVKDIKENNFFSNKINTLTNTKITYEIPIFSENPKLTNIDKYALCGEELYEWTKTNKINVLELVNKLIVSYSNDGDGNGDNINMLNLLDFLATDKYGLCLKKLLNDKTQMITLMMFQQYCERLNYPKILYKNKNTYLIRVLFQVLFINEIIDEGVFNTWLDYISDDKDKQTLIIQTNDFFMILKTIFDDEKEEKLHIDDDDGIKTVLDEELVINNKTTNTNTNINVDVDNLDEDFNLDDL